MSVKLCCRCQSGQASTSIIKILLAARQSEDLDSTHQSWDNVTPLHAAVQSKHDCVEVIELLVNASSCLDAVSDDGSFPLLSAARSGHSKCFSALLAHGAMKKAVGPEYIPNEVLKTGKLNNVFQNF